MKIININNIYMEINITPLEYYAPAQPDRPASRTSTTQTNLCASPRRHHHHFRSTATSFETTNAKPLLLVLHTNFRKLIPTTVTPDLSYQNFSLFVKTLVLIFIQRYKFIKI